MDVKCFVVTFIFMLIYLASQIIATCKIVNLSIINNPLRKKELDDVNSVFKTSIVMTGLFLFVFATFFIPDTSHMYNEIALNVTMYFVGLVALYESSCKKIQDLQKINTLMLVNSFIMLFIPYLILFIAVNA